MLLKVGGAIGGIILNQKKDMIERYPQNPIAVPIASDKTIQLAYNGTICSNIFNVCFMQYS
jgi:cation transporter-like permease